MSRAMTALRIVHVLDHALPEVSGYSVRSHNVLCAQRALGLDACAVAQSSRVARITEDCVDGVPYVLLPRPSTDAPATAAASAQRMVRVARYLHRTVVDRRVDLLHAHTPSLNGLPALWVAGRCRLPFIYEMRSLWEATAVHRGLISERTLRYRAARALETWLIRRAPALAVISQGLHEEALRRGVPRTRIFGAPNGVDTRRFRPIAPDPELRRRYGLADRLVFGYIGFFVAYEGVDVLLQAFAQTTAALPQARLLLVGDGEQAAALRALAQRLGVESQVIFVGSVPHEEVQRWYSVCDVLVYPRRRSDLTALVTPLKPLEAMAMGKPVVAAAVGGLQELIRDGETGVLCTPDDTAALAAALAALAAAPPRREAIGANARRFVCAERDWSQLAANYERVYRRLVAASRQRTG